jgi:hypothetical protein
LAPINRQHEKCLAPLHLNKLGGEMTPSFEPMPPARQRGTFVAHPDCDVFFACAFSLQQLLHAKPLIFCVFPSLLTVLLGPVAVTLTKEFVQSV